MASAVIEQARMASPVGDLAVAAVGGRLCLVAFDDDAVVSAALDRRLPGLVRRAAPDPAGALSALGAYFAGDLHALDALEVDPPGTPFQRSIWQALRSVPSGSTATYGEIARRARSPRAVRAAGSATGANPVAIVVPCHRILPAAGGLGNYGGGVDRKRWLLLHEGVSP